MNAQEFGKLLYDAAHWLSGHPELPAPYSVEPHRKAIEVQWISQPKSTLALIARALGNCEKRAGNGYFNLNGGIGPGVQVRAFTSQEDVCTRVVTGTRHVEEKIVPQQVIPAHEEEVIEWECPESLLAGTER